MRPVFVVLIILSFPNLSFCDFKLDSLLNILTEVKEEEKVDVLIELSWTLKYSDIDKSEKYAKKGLQLAQELGYQKGIGNAYSKLAIANSIQNKFDISNQNNEAAIKIFQSLNDAKSIAICWGVMGINARKKGAYDLGLAKYAKALNIFETLKDTSSILQTEGNIANIYYVKGDYTKALVTYQKLIKFFKETGDMDSEARFTGNAARSYTKQGNYAKALDYFYKANTIIDSLGQTYEKANNLNNIGLIFFNLDMIPEAIETYHNSLQLIQELKDTKRKADIFSNIGNCYLELGKYTEAKEYYIKALTICKNLEIKPISFVLLNFAKITIEDQDYKEADRYLTEAYRIDSETNNKINIASNLHLQGRIRYAEGDLDLSISKLDEALTLWVETDALPKIETTASLLIKIYREKKEHELAYKTQDLLDQTLDSLAIINDKSVIFQTLVRAKIKELNRSNVSSLKERTSTNKNSFLLPLFFLSLVLCGVIYYYKNKKDDIPSKLVIEEENLKDRKNENDVFLKSVDVIINKNIQNPNFNVAELAKNLQTNRSQLNLKLKHFAGISPSKYIQKIRLEKAIELLHHKELTIAEIAVHTGYDANYFARVFKQVYGLSPKKYRETNTNHK